MSPVHVGEVSSVAEVERGGDAPGAAPAPQAPWDLEQQQRELQAQVARDRDRTRCGGFDA